MLTHGRRHLIGGANLLLVGDSWTDDTYSWGQYGSLLSGGLTVVNEGTAAQTVQFLAANIATDLSNNPTTDVCVVCSSGINDIVGRSAAQIQADIVSCYDAIVAANAWPVFVGIPRSSSWVAGGLNDKVDEVEDYCASYFAARGVPFIALKPLVSDDTGIYSGMSEDALHLNENGGAVVAQAVMGCIKATSWRKAAVA
jgi:lysophospholipase L1-like esterase